MEIDHSHFGLGKLQNFPVGTDGDDFSLTNGNCLGYRVPGIYGQDSSVDQNQIGHLSGCCETRQEAGEGNRLEHESEFTLTNLGSRRHLAPTCCDSFEKNNGRASPEFLSSLVALANLMRLSLLKAAHVDVSDCRVAGNPGRPSFSAHVRSGERGAPVLFYRGSCCLTDDGKNFLRSL